MLVVFDMEFLGYYRQLDLLKVCLKFFSFSRINVRIFAPLSERDDFLFIFCTNTLGGFLAQLGSILTRGFAPPSAIVMVIHDFVIAQG